MAYLFNPKFWISGSIGQIASGETSINGVGQNNNQKNSRYGIGRRQYFWRGQTA